MRGNAESTMIRRLLRGAPRTPRTVQALEDLAKAEALEAALRGELLRHRLPRELHAVVLDYCPVLYERLGLRTGTWSHHCYGGEPRYSVSLRRGKSTRARVAFPGDVWRPLPGGARARLQLGIPDAHGPGSRDGSGCASRFRRRWSLSSTTGITCARSRRSAFGTVRAHAGPGCCCA